MYLFCEALWDELWWAQAENLSTVCVGVYKHTLTGTLHTCLQSVHALVLLARANVCIISTLAVCGRINTDCTNSPVVKVMQIMQSENSLHSLSAHASRAETKDIILFLLQHIHSAKYYVSVCSLGKMFK